MALQKSVTVRNAHLDAVEVAIGASPVLKIRTGDAPANCAASDSGSVLASLALPSDWMAAASGGVKSKAGTWQGTASGGGIAGHFRIYDSGGSTCHLQGTVTITGGGGDIEVDNTVFASGQAFSITGFDITAGNA